MSIQEAVMAAIGALLDAIPNANFFRSRQVALDRTEVTAIVLYPEEDRVEKRTQSPDISFCRLTIVIAVLTRGDVPDQIADPFRVAVHAAVMADPTIGGRCSKIVAQGTRWQFAEADLTAGVAEMRYDILYLMPSASLAVAL